MPKLAPMFKCLRVETPHKSVDIMVAAGGIYLHV
jgi:hypothetical protein